MSLLDWLFGKKQNDSEIHRIKFQCVIYDEGEQIEPNKWYQKASWKNKQFIGYKGYWGPDWKYASDFPGESNAKVAGISRENRSYYFLKLAQSDDFKMYLEDDPTNPVNKNARKVMASGTVGGELLTKHIGYLPDEIANEYANVELNISPRSAYLPTNADLNLGLEVTLLRRSVRYLKKKAKEENRKEQEIEASKKKDDGIVTTKDEVEGYNIVKAIVREVVDVKRVYMRDTKSYCGILFDNNNRKPICRLRFNTPQKSIGLFKQKQEEKVSIDNVDDIFKYSERLKETVKEYL